DMEVVDRIGLERLPGRPLPADLRQPAYAVALEATMQGRARQARNGRLERIQAVVQSQQRVFAKGDSQGLLLGRQHRRAWRSRPHRRIVHECSLAPLGHGLVIQAVLGGQLFERNLRSLYRSSDGVRGRGAAVKYLDHSPSRNEGSV